MPADPIVDSTGLHVWRAADVRESLVDGIHSSASFGITAHTGPSSVLGQVLDCPTPQVGMVYDLLQALWDQWDPDNASGAALDNLVRFAGLFRLQPTYGTVTLTLSGDVATPIPAGNRFRQPNGLIYATDEACVIGALGTVDAICTATTTGNIEVPAGTVTQIVDAIAGLNSCTNALDGVPGRDLETDVALRLRREATVAGAGSCTDQSTRRALDSVTDVTASVVLSNRTDTTDEYGTYARTRRCIVYPSTVEPALIARAIWDHLGGGLNTQGAQVATVRNEKDHEWPVRWDWATPVNVYWAITVTPTSLYPSNGADLVKAATLAYGRSLGVGDDVLPVGAIDWIVDSVPGVKHLVVCVGTSANPTSTIPLEIDITDVSVHDTTRISVT